MLSYQRKLEVLLIEDIAFVVLGDEDDALQADARGVFRRAVGYVSDSETDGEFLDGWVGGERGGSDKARCVYGVGGSVEEVLVERGGAGGEGAERGSDGVKFDLFEGRSSGSIGVVDHVV